MSTRAPMSAPAGTPVVPTLQEAALLVVEDRPSDRRLIEETLVDVGADRSRVAAVASLTEARGVLSVQPVDCILLDLSLPDASGLQGVAVLSAAAPDTPIVVVTGRPPGALVYAAMAEGADEYLCKDDLDPERLHDVVVRAIQRRRGVERSRRARTAASVVLDSIEAPTAALDGSGRIVAVNEAWADVAERAGAPTTTTGVGVNYLTVCDHAAGLFADGATEAASGIRDVLSGRARRFAMDYPCPSGGVDAWFSLRVTPMGEIGGGAVVTHLDITDLKVAEQRLHHDEARLHGVFDESSPLFMLLDADGMVLQASETTTKLLGLRPEVTIGADAFSRIDPADLDGALDAFARVLAVPGERRRMCVRALDGNGRWRELELVLANLVEDPRVGAIAVTGSDITDGRLHQIARRLETRLLQRLPTAVVVTDHRDVIVYWNDRATACFGYAAEAALGRTMTELDLVPPPPAAAAMDAALAELGRWEGDYEARRSDGSTIPVHTSRERIDDDDIDFHGVVSASIDITERRQLEEHLAFQALHDPLTGLPNRRLFVDHLEHCLSRGLRTGRRTAVVFIDLDDFKAVNDRIGHAAGDAVLRAVGDRMASVLRTGDVVARLGGDEFVLCCDDLIDLEEATTVIDRLLDSLRHPFEVNGDAMVVSASVGVALSGGQAAADGLLRDADAAMYAAKERGKDRVEIFDDALRNKVRRRRQYAAVLGRAIDDGEISTCFQPAYCLRTGDLVGFEALARWEHSSSEATCPEEFIPIAEDSGLIDRIDHQVLTDACRALSSWLQARPDRPCTVSVNVSARQLTDPHFPLRVRTVIEHADVPADHVCLEVTESALVDTEVAAVALRRLKAIGVDIAIDDFGTGYSSLSRLHRFPVDFLKIDRSFVAGMTQRREDAAIVASVIGLARSLGVRTIAEGIEDDAQIAQLASLECDFGQGFRWSPAVSAAEAARLVAGGG